MSDLNDALMGTPAAVTSGWSKLGQVLGGSCQATANAYQRGVMQGAQTSDVMEQARRRRDQNVGFEAITPADIKAALSGDADAQARVIANQQVAGGGNASELAQGLNTGQTTEFRAALMHSAQNGAPISQLNPSLAVLGGKPVETTGIEGNTLVDKYVDPDQQGSVGGNVPTAIGQSEMALHVAQANDANAAAGEHAAGTKRQLAGIGADKAANYVVGVDGNNNMVRTDKLTGIQTPITDTSGKPVLAPTGGNGSGGNYKPEVLEQLLGKPAPGGKPNAEMVEYATYKAQHQQADPRFANDTYAMPQFLLAKQGKAATGSVADTASTDDDAMGLTPQQIQATRTGIPVAGSSDMSAAINSAAPATPAPASGAIPKITNEQDYNALPAGAHYIDPSGVTRVKQANTQATQ